MYAVVHPKPNKNATSPILQPYAHPSRAYASRSDARRCFSEACATNVSLGSSTRIVCRLLHLANLSIYTQDQGQDPYKGRKTYYERCGVLNKQVFHIHRDLRATSALVGRNLGKQQKEHLGVHNCYIVRLQIQKVVEFRSTCIRYCESRKGSIRGSTKGQQTFYRPLQKFLYICYLVLKQGHYISHHAYMQFPPLPTKPHLTIAIEDPF